MHESAKVMPLLEFFLHFIYYRPQAFIGCRCESKNKKLAVFGDL
jgi:hypothetical protein